MQFAEYSGASGEGKVVAAQARDRYDWSYPRAEGPGCDRRADFTLTLPLEGRGVLSGAYAALRSAHSIDFNTSSGRLIRRGRAHGAALSHRTGRYALLRLS